MTVRMPDPGRRVRAYWRSSLSSGRLALLLLLLLNLLGAQPARVNAVLSTPPAIDDLAGATIGEAAWADYDHDGAQELLITGRGNASATTFIYEYTATGMVAHTLNLKALEASSAAWGDYDNDGWLDLLLTGWDGATLSPFAGVYRNVSGGPTGRTFSLVRSLTGVYLGKGRWGDYDNDGRSDILLTGYRSNPAAGLPDFVPTTLVYHNNGGGNFSAPAAANAGLLGLSNSSANWGDFNMDGYLDFALTGMQETWNAGDPGTTPVAPRTLVYMNNQSGSFSLINTGMPGLWKGSVNWFDYNRDGSIDLLITGNEDTVEAPPYHPRTLLYRYNHNTDAFEQVSNTNLPGLWTSTVVPGDYNNDGFPDLLINGRTSTSRPTAIYTYDKSTKAYKLEPLSLPEGAELLLAMGDFNGSAAPDRTLDVAISGVMPQGTNKYHTYFYYNTLAPLPPNSPPDAPAVRAACWNGDPLTPHVEFYWDTATDDHDPLLTYNLRLGTSASPAALLNPLSDSASGYHYLPQPGNMNVSTYYPAAALSLGQSYIWSVQAVDASYAGGPFSPSGQVDLGQTVAVDDSFNAHENVPLTFSTADLTGNDRAAYQPVSYLWNSSNPTHGTLALNGDTLTYTPEANWNGIDTFSYYAVGKNAYCTSATVSINVGSFNFPPTAIGLAPSSLYPQPAGWVKVGMLSAADPDPEQTTFTYAIVAGPGGDDNARFQIRNGSELWANGPLASAESPYSVRIQVTDSGTPPMTYAEPVQVTVIPNAAPSDISLSPGYVLANAPVGSSVGTLTAADPDLPGDTLTYTFVNDSAGPDNSLFSLSGGTLLTAKAISASPNSRQIHLKVTDRGGLTYHEVLVLPVYDTQLMYMPVIGKE